MKIPFENGLSRMEIGTRPQVDFSGYGKSFLISPREETCNFL